MNRVGLPNLIELINANLGDCEYDDESACQKCYYKWQSIRENIENIIDVKTLV